MEGDPILPSTSECDTPTDYIRVNHSPSTTQTIVVIGVRMQYDQKIVRLNRRSNASPDAAWVICESTHDTSVTLSIRYLIEIRNAGRTWARVSAGGLEMSSTFDTMNTGLQERKQDGRVVNNTL